MTRLSHEPVQAIGRRLVTVNQPRCLATCSGTDESAHATACTLAALWNKEVVRRSRISRAKKKEAQP
jgi:hypothetical protein